MRACRMLLLFCAPQTNRLITVVTLPAVPSRLNVRQCGFCHTCTDSSTNDISHIYFNRLRVSFFSWGHALDILKTFFVVSFMYVLQLRWRIGSYHFALDWRIVVVCSESVTHKTYINKQIHNAMWSHMTNSRLRTERWLDLGVCSILIKSWSCGNCKQTLTQQSYRVKTDYKVHLAGSVSSFKTVAWWVSTHMHTNRRQSTENTFSKGNFRENPCESMRRRILARSPVNKWITVRTFSKRVQFAAVNRLHMKLLQIVQETAIRYDASIHTMWLLWLRSIMCPRCRHIEINDIRSTDTRRLRSTYNTLQMLLTYTRTKTHHHCHLVFRLQPPGNVDKMHSNRHYDVVHHSWNEQKVHCW